MSSDLPIANTAEVLESVPVAGLMELPGFCDVLRDHGTDIEVRGVEPWSLPGLIDGFLSRSRQGVAERKHARETALRRKLAAAEERQRVLVRALEERDRESADLRAELESAAHAVRDLQSELAALRARLGEGEGADGRQNLFGWPVRVRPEDAEPWQRVRADVRSYGACTVLGVVGDWVDADTPTARQLLGGRWEEYQELADPVEQGGCSAHERCCTMSSWR
ncbi:hypothetical protein ACFQVC_23760 [Streptomyces monticola]|uniref:Uncharacterized protein n=1 Tax=Streptomyces monticola TaxID=2666263 RepID=A0ABW2JP50_9ACTN